MEKYRHLGILIIILLFIANGLSQSSDSDSTTTVHCPIGYDKFQHVAVSCLLTLSGQYVFEDKSNFSQNKALNYSISSSAMIGITKELNDMQTRNKPFDWGDMIANFIGIGIAVLIITI